jgi:maleylacetate reductase
MSNPDRPTNRGFEYALRSLRVVFRDGAADGIGSEMERLDVGRGLTLCTPGRRETADRIVRASADRIIAVYDGAREHVPVDLVDVVMKRVDDQRPDSLVAIGGGSAIGLAKAIALRTSLPIIALPTTYSGSEMTSVWGSSAHGRKTTGRDERVAPRVVIYDPMVTYDLPIIVSMTSGMNAIAHAVESLYAPDANPIASLLAAQAIDRLASALRTLARRVNSARAEFTSGAGSAEAAIEPSAPRPSDPSAEVSHSRSDALLGAHLAGRALDMTHMGLHHRLCHALGGMFGTPHALTHAILLPCVAAFLLPAAPRAQAIIAQALGVDDAARGLDALRADLGIHTTLRDLGLAAPDLDAVATAVAASAPDHPRKPSVDDVRAILEAAWLSRRLP